MNDHDPQRDELAAYLLGALDPSEAAELEKHLATCEECRAALAWFRPAAGILPGSVERVEPPPELRARIMAEVRVEAKSTGSGLGGLRRSLGGFWRRIAGGASIRRPLAATLTGIVLVAGGLAAYAIRDTGSIGDATTVRAGKAPGVTAKLVREGDSTTLRLANVRHLPSDEVLQAWVRRGERIESAETLFVPNRDGIVTAVIGDLDGVNAVMVTAEPRGGSEFPTSEPLVSIAVPQ